MRRTDVRAAVGAAALVVLAACGGDGVSAGVDAASDATSDGGRDGGRIDASSSDAGPDLDAHHHGADAGIGLDATTSDAASTDAAIAPDAPTGDGGSPPDLDAFVEVDASSEVDAGIDAGIDAGPPADIDAGPIDASAPSARISLVRATHGPLATPIHIDTVQITYVLPAIGDDPGGVFVQSDLLGPALFVAIDPASLTPPPLVGAYASFSVTATAVVSGQHRVTGLLPGSWFATSTPILGGIVAEPQGLRSVAVPSMIGELESELTVNELDVVSAFAACGLDRYCAQVTSAGVPTASPSYRVRTTQSIASALGLARRCHLTMGEYPSALAHPTPLWRRGSEADPQVTYRDELTSVACPPGRVIGAYATGTTSVTVVLDAPLAPGTVAAADFTWIGGVSTISATVSPASPYLVGLTTTALAHGSTNTVAVSGVRDVLGNDVLDGSSATFTARAAGTTPNAAGQIVITEVMHDPAGGGAAGEWIELHNPGTSPLALTGCTLSDATSAPYTLTALTIAGGGRVTLSSGADPGFPESQSYGGALALDATDSVVLRCGGTLVDRVDWTAAFQSASGRSLSLDPQHHAAALNDDAVAWCTATSSYGPGRGTPGAPNDDCR